MASFTPKNSLGDSFQYQKSAEMDKCYSIKNARGKRLFEKDFDTSSDEESVHIDKKVKTVKPPVDTDGILKAYQLKEYENCLKLFEAMDESEESTTFKIIRAACWTMIGTRSEETFEILNQVIKAEPRNSFAFYGLGLAQYRQGDLSGCLESFRAAIDLNPYGAMKRALEFKGKAKSFIDLIQNANVQFEKNNFSRAVQILNAASVIDPDNKNVIKSIANIRNSYVKDLIDKLEVDIKNDFPDKFRDAEKLIFSNQLVKAERLVDEIVNENPESGRAYYIKGLAVYMTGSLKESIKLFNQAAEIDETVENAKVMEEKAITLQDLTQNAAQEMNDKNYSQAIETLTKALSVDRENRVVNQLSHYQRALAYFNLGQMDKAFEDFKRFELIKKMVGNVLKKIEEDGEEARTDNVEDGKMSSPKIEEAEKSEQLDCGEFKKFDEDDKHSENTSVESKETGREDLENKEDFVDDVKDFENQDVKNNDDVKNSLQDFESTVELLNTIERQKTDRDDVENKENFSDDVTDSLQDLGNAIELLNSIENEETDRKDVIIYSNDENDSIPIIKNAFELLDSIEDAQLVGSSDKMLNLEIKKISKSLSMLEGED